MVGQLPLAVQLHCRQKELMALFCATCAAQIVLKRVGFCPSCRSLLPETMRLNEQARSMIDTEHERAKRAAKQSHDSACGDVGSGWSDDDFNDFRATLISHCREIYERALSDPESLAELTFDDVGGSSIPAFSDRWAQPRGVARAGFAGDERPHFQGRCRCIGESGLWACFSGHFGPRGDPGSHRPGRRQKDGTDHSSGRED
ncbi:MAG: DUF4240 domain-containing protein [Verrucomicrobiales bacterium]